MRPTMLMFRSPKERTPEFYNPKVTSDGHLLSFGRLPTKKRKMSKVRVNTSFSKQERFLDYKYLARVTSKKLGPGTYEDFENFKIQRKKPCPTRIRCSVLGEDTKDPCYMYIGNNLVFEPEFSRSFKPKNDNRSVSNYRADNWNKRPCSRLCSTLHNNSIDVCESSIENKNRQRVKTAKIRVHKRHNSSSTKNLGNRRKFKSD